MHVLTSPRRLLAFVGALLAIGVLPACSGESGTSLTVYSGRTKDLVGPLFSRFEKETGVKVKVRYGDSSEMSAAVLEEGDRPAADVLIVQDAGHIGEVEAAGRLGTLGSDILEPVPAAFRSASGAWVGLSGRSRVVAYNSEKVGVAELPTEIEGFTDPKWKGRLAWAPTNGSFQAFVTAFRVLKGEAATESWLRGIKANDPKVFPNNISIVEAVGRGEVDAGFVNHYYLHRLRAEGKAGKAENRYFGSGDPGGFVNVAAAGITKGAPHKADAERFIRFLLSEPSQRYFAETTFELPVIASVRADPQLPEIASLTVPQIDLARTSDIKGSVALLTKVGAL